jgi:hypothetical protein
LHGILLLDRGASVSGVQRSMRHSTPTMTMRYHDPTGERPGRGGHR